MRAFRRLVMLALAVCLLPSCGTQLAQALGTAGDCVGIGEGDFACRLGGRPLVAGITVANALGRLAVVTVPVGFSVLVFWALAEAARLMGVATRRPRDD